MNKISIAASAAALSLLFGPFAAFAQYYPNYSASPSYSPAPAYASPGDSSCVGAVLPQDLARGASDPLGGGAVSALQRFLVAQNYPGGGSWMVTGHFGAATEQALKNFQITRGIAPSGIVDLATRAAIPSCSSSYAPAPAPAPVAAPAPLPSYGTLGGYSGYSPSTYLGTGAYDSTLYPAGFNSFFGSCATLGIFGSIVNAVNCRPLSAGATISSITPSSGGAGTLVTISGTNFSPYGNTVHVGQGILAGLPSSDGTTISFVLPPQLYGERSRKIPISYGQTSVSVSNAQGFSNNSLPFDLVPTAYPGGNGPSITNYVVPTIVSIESPLSLKVGEQGTWKVLVANGLLQPATTVSVKWGDEGSGGYSSLITPSDSDTSNQRTVSFSHSYFTAGTYTVQFTLTTSGGFQTTSTVTATVAS